MREWLAFAGLIALSFAGCAVAATPAPEPVSAPQAPSEATRLIVRVIGKASRTPLAGVNVQLFDPQTERASSTDREGRVEFDVPPGLDFDLTAEAQGNLYARARQAIDYLRPGEQREIVVELPRGDGSNLVGSVVDAVSRTPIAGAIVRLVHVDPSRGGPNPMRAASLTTTRTDGSFEVSFLEWRSPHLRIEAEGYGLELAAATAGHEDAQHALRVELSRAARLEAAVRDPAGHGIAGAWVVVKATSRALGSIDAPDELWAAETDAEGRTVLDGLPAGIPLRIDVRRDGEVLVQEPEPLELRAGARHPLEWRIGTGTWLHGLVLDQEGEPVPGQEIWVGQDLKHFRSYFSPRDDDEIVRRATTDAQGRFVIQNLPPGRWSIGPAATRDDEAAVAPFAVHIESHSEPSRELTLRVWRGIYLRGRVVGPTGEPVGKSFVGAGTEDRRDWLNARTAEDGSFRIGPLVPGRYELEASSHEELAASDRVFAEAGDSDSLLKLKPGGALRVRVIDAQTGSPREATLMITRHQIERAGIEGSMGTSTSRDGISLLRGLDPGRYRVAAKTVSGHFAVHSGIEVAAGAAPVEVELPLRPGGTLKLTYQGAKPMVHATITSDGVPVNFFEAIPRGQAKSVPAPAGKLVLELRSDFFGLVRRMSIELRAGETKEITLTDED